MIPIRDLLPRRRTPYITYSLIALNVLVFLFQNSLSAAALDRFVTQWGVVPAQLAGWQNQPFILLTLITSIFLHGGWFHVLGNMLYLWVFGDNVEDRLGHFRYLIFYLAGGVLAGLVQVFFTAGSPIPAIGASGAVAAVLGAYMVLYPGARVVVLIPLFIWFQTIAVPSVFVLGFWFISQFFNGLFSLAAMSATYSGGVAWWAHVGGFLVGVIVARLWGKPQVPPPAQHPIIYHTTYR